MNPRGWYQWFGWSRILAEPGQDDRRSLQQAVLPGEAVNDRPEPVPYRYQGRPDWEPSQVKIYPRDYEQNRAEKAEWAAANAALVAEVRARLEAR